VAETKTRPTDVSVADFLAAVEPADKRADALALDALFQKITGFTPRMWGPTMVGYGRYEYVYASGHGGTSMAAGFSPRKAEHSIYILPGYLDMSDQLARLGKHKIGKACLYVKRLSDIQLDVLEAMIRAGLADLEKRWPVTPT
jgi:hypothetical protein